ncbi:MAG TPA: hypothetical protein VIG99_21515 [Myxococcaceae bacterium]|jgi:hypothetical protein
MRALWNALGVGLVLSLWACGPTVGDACTTNGDCGGAECLQGGNAPGGYCSVNCGNDNGCPHGSACWRGSGPGSGSCRLICTRNEDCRTGYTCADTGTALVCTVP